MRYRGVIEKKIKKNESKDIKFPPLMRVFDKLPDLPPKKQLEIKKAKSKPIYVSLFLRWKY